jgi:transcriptional regulator with XRE-family HTH domain
MKKNIKKYPVLLEVKGRIRAKGYTLESLAKEIVTSPTTLSQKLNGKRYFTVHDIVKLSKILDIKSEDIGNYFFPQLRNAKESNAS